MLISIITAVYNGADSIAATLHSVAQQDYPQIEHILVDGGSTDSTLAVARACDSRLACVISEPDDGVYDAFNKGLRRATGDVIAFLGCGDVYTSTNVVSRMAKTLSSDGVQAVFADVHIVDGRDHHLIRRYSSKRFSPAGMAYGFMPAHPSLFVRREVYDRVGGYNTDFKIAGDFEMCVRIFVTDSIRYRYLNEAVVNMPTGGLSNRGWRSKLAITREMGRACAMNNVKTNLAKLCMRFPLKVLELR